jgi:ABC-2 type transport system ATP-binding protein
VTEPALEVLDLSRSFGPLEALSSLSFSVGRGELFGLVGPDGAGKTTLLRILAGVLRPTAGEARVLGISLTRDPERAKPHLAYMPQRFGLYEDLTVQENMDFYADLFAVPVRDRREREARLYRFSGLAPFRDRLAGALSGGMKQKLGLSCALIHQPEVLLLDEPTFGVDPISRRDLWLILHEMVASGITVVVSTAYMDEAERADRVALLHEGRLLDLDTPDRLQRTLEGRLVAVESPSPRAVRDMLRSAGVPAALFGETVHAELPSHGETDELGAILAKTGLSTTSISPVRPSLEDVFIHKVREEEEASAARTSEAGPLPGEDGHA